MIGRRIFMNCSAAVVGMAFVCGTATAYKNRRKLLRGYCQIVAKLAKEFDALHIRTQEIFDKAAKNAPPSHWIWDGIHPLPQGHELIARNWIKEVSKHWP